MAPRQQPRASYSTAFPKLINQSSVIPPRCTLGLRFRVVCIPYTTLLYFRFFTFCVFHFFLLLILIFFLIFSPLPSTYRNAIMASHAPHKPRRKAKAEANDIDGSPNKTREVLVRAPTFPLASFLWPARTSSSQWEVLPLVLMVAGLFRWAAGLWGYSGSFDFALRMLALNRRLTCN